MKELRLSDSFPYLGLCDVLHLEKGDIFSVKFRIHFKAPEGRFLISGST